ncbi:MAG: DUF1624 domain-containing protein [Gammaproteobacteria bacterium]|nr:DUF1624 domain-containing protein [Gammaproteobacteria bacterium]
MPYARLQSVDLLRGLAIATMITYHFCYDLTYFGFAQFDFFTDPFWLHARTLILSSFLLVAGISLTLATHNGVCLRPYLKRLGMIAGCAALISATSYFMFGPRWIFFGVLHFIAVASALGLFFVRQPRLALLLGIALLALDRVFSHTFFDQTALQWLGLMTFKPPTEDYVPLIPWFGVVLIGIFLGNRVWLRTPPPALAHWHGTQPLTRLLSLAGRHSLLVYMLHQPLLLGLLWMAKQVV